jgi:hypothetical protein
VQARVSAREAIGYDAPMVEDRRRTPVNRSARPDPLPRTRSARTLNPEAGEHAVAIDPLALAAATVAIERTYATFPYYVHRYGERGRRFSTSDSAWLALLGDETTESALREIRWLGKVLTSRGMPRLLLESHLRELAAELDAAQPERAARHDRLRECADALAAERRARIDDPTFETLTTSFDARVGKPWSETHRRTGQILVAAVADERCGFDRAVTSLSDWMTDPERFPEHWIEAVLDTLSAARRAMR